MKVSRYVIHLALGLAHSGCSTNLDSCPFPYVFAPFLTSHCCLLALHQSESLRVTDFLFLWLLSLTKSHLPIYYGLIDMVLSTTFKVSTSVYLFFSFLLSFSLSFWVYDLSAYNFTKDVSGLSIIVHNVLL